MTVTEIEPVPVRPCRICGSPLPTRTKPSQREHSLRDTCAQALGARVTTLEGLLAALARNVAESLNWRSL